MHGVRLRVLVATTAIVAMGLLGACGSDSADPEPSASAAVEVIEPVASIPGSTPTTVGGITVDVPEGFSGETKDLGNGVTQLVITRDGAPRAEANVVVTRQDTVTDDTVVASSQLTQARLGTNVENLTSTPATWEGFGPAVVLRATLPLDTGNKDMVLVTTRDPAGTRVVGLSSEAPEGDLEDSVGYQIMRSARVAE